LTSFDNNLIETTTGCTIVNNNASNKLGVDPKLGALLPHNGAPATRALLAGSPAIDAGNSEACVGPGPGVHILQTDQRGQPRYADGNADGFAICDIGAFELQLEIWLPLVVR